MFRLISWIRKHWIIAIIICVALFFVPMLLTHILFKMVGCKCLQANWSAGDVLSYIAGFEAFLGTICLGMLSLWQNERINKEYVLRLEPCLSMKLVVINNYLHLIVENTGPTEARDVELKIVDILDNGGFLDLPEGGIFENRFDLYSGEIVQGKVGLFGAGITQDAFPRVIVHVAYMRPDTSENREYKRTVAYSDGYDKKIAADVNYDNNSLEKDTKSISQSVVRIANYLDAHQLFAFDDANILSGNSLRNDLVEAIKTKEESSITNREETLRNRF